MKNFILILVLVFYNYYPCTAQFNPSILTLEINTSLDKSNPLYTLVQFELHNVKDSTYEVKVKQNKFKRDKKFELTEKKIVDTSFLISGAVFDDIVRKILQLNTTEIVKNFEPLVFLHPTSIKLTYGTPSENITYSFIYTKNRKYLQPFFETCKHILKISNVRNLLK